MSVRYRSGIQVILKTIIFFEMTCYLSKLYDRTFLALPRLFLTLKGQNKLQFFGED